MTQMELREAEPGTVKAWLESDQAVLIDIREPDEYAREHIPGAQLVPLSGFDATAPAAPEPARPRRKS